MKKIKINHIENNTLAKLDMSNVFGGVTCGCACRYANSGGSSTNDNGAANIAAGKVSVGYRLQDCKVIHIDGDTWD